ncbi:glycosyltransferase family 2 protein [Paenibacillus sp. FJAT-26967]|uniref:glycosyltransferase n=1 Tax=Paenibacillus sp. FJAT-26967 TaxID=1729690 RepID=UPI0008382DBC|nr:glycosyltransferase [Paenibacillus sp. FJAT-26967]
MFAWLIGSFSLFFTLWLVWNLKQWPAVVPAKPQRTPRVSVLIPARNEERNIVRCVESLAAQSYPAYEIIILDDRSDDRTPILLSMLSERYPQLTIIPGQELPPGWVGKVHACHQLQQAASGEWLLFVDADTMHGPQMLESVMACAEAKDTSFATGFPRIYSSHLFGWLVLPMLHFIIALHLPVKFVSASKDDRFMAAHGAFMLFTREAYDAIGGHAAFPSEMVEDMALARAVKQAGYKAELLDITPVVSCEMYETPAEVVEGFTKNIFIGIGRSSSALLALLVMYGALYVWPPIGALIAGINGDYSTAALWTACYLTGCLQKRMVDLRFGVYGRRFWLLPLSFGCLGYIALRSWRIGITKKGYVWKGRVYR